MERMAKEHIFFQSFGFEFSPDILPDLITIFSYTRTECDQKGGRITPVMFFQASDNFERQSLAGALPAAMGGGGDLFIGIHDQNRKTICSFDDKKQARLVRQQGIPGSHFFGNRIDEVMDVRMDLA